MKIISFLFTIFLSVTGFAHEGHGEAPTDPAKYGGILANVVSEARMQKKEKNNPALLKAEVVRSEDGTLRLYVYDLTMKPQDLKVFAAEASGVVENTKAKTKDSFKLGVHGNHFMGQLPKQKKRPFNLYITLQRGTEKLFVGFDNLD